MLECDCRLQLVVVIVFSQFISTLGSNLQHKEQTESESTVDSSASHESIRESTCCPAVLSLSVCFLLLFLSMLLLSVISAAAATDIPPTREMIFDQPLGTVSQRAPPTWK